MGSHKFSGSVNTQRSPLWLKNSPICGSWSTSGSSLHLIRIRSSSSKIIELDFDQDDTKMFSNRATYFAADPSAASFDGFTAEENEKAKQMISNKADGRYRDIVHDKDMYEQIYAAVEPFLTTVSLKQIWHSYSTNRNENMNHVVATYAPKHCQFSSSLSLATRVSLASSTQVIGHLPYWSMLLHRAGITMHPSVMSYLKERDNKRER